MCWHIISSLAGRAKAPRRREAMSDQKITFLLIDTSYLRAVSFSDPDFRKLPQRSKEDVLKIFIPHIVREERRTQFREVAYDKVRKLRQQFDGLKRAEEEIALRKHRYGE